MRFSVTILLVAVTLAAFSISALLSASEQSMRSMASLVLAANVVAVTVAIFGSRHSRVFAAGFLIASLTYLGIARWIQGGTRYLVTDVALEVIDSTFKISAPRRTPNGELVHVLPTGYAVITDGWKSRRVTRAELLSSSDAKYAYSSDQMPSRIHFLIIGHFAWSILFGCCNGGLAVWLVRRKVSNDPSRSFGV